MRGHEAPGVVASLHCGHPDSEVDAAVTASVQFTSVLVLSVVTLRFGSVVVDLFEMIGQLIINTLIVTAGNSAAAPTVWNSLNPDSLRSSVFQAAPQNTPLPSSF